MDQYLKAIKRGDIQSIIRLYLLNPRLNPAVKSNAAIRWASQTGNAAAVVALLKDPRVDPSSNMNEAIKLAAKNGHVEIISLLIKDPRVDSSDNVVIRCAIKHGHVDLVKFLLQHSRVNPAENFISAARYGHVEVVKLLLADGRVNPAEDTAIQYAAMHGHVEVVKLLLQDTRVDPAAADNSAILYAIMNGYVEIAALLMKDVRINIANVLILLHDERVYARISYNLHYYTDRYSPFASSIITRVVQYGHTEIVALLITNGLVSTSYMMNIAIKYSHTKMICLLFRDMRQCPRHDKITQLIDISIIKRLLLRLYMYIHPRAEIGLIPWILTYDPLFMGK